MLLAQGAGERLEGVVPAVRGPRPRLTIGGGGPRILRPAAREALRAGEEPTR